MSFDTNPADEDPHGECRHEIKGLRAELDMVRSVAHKDNLRAADADRYEQWLLDIGKLTGCGHVDDRLPRCIEEEFLNLRYEAEWMRRKLGLPKDASTTDVQGQMHIPVTVTCSHCSWQFATIDERTDESNN